MLWVFTGVLPVVQYVDARVVPDGADVQPAQVTGFSRALRRAGDDNGQRGRIVVLELPDGTSEQLALSWRWDYPEVGDTLEVYADPGEDGELASPEQASLVQLILGLLCLVAWPVATIGYLRSRRRPAVAPSRP